MILFIKHIDIEGPDILDEFFQNHGYDTKTAEIYSGDSLPEDLSSLNAVISLGGPMNVYEEDKYPFLKDEHIFVQRILSECIPFMGICLGSQILAKACHAKVGKSPEKEIGFKPIQISPEGLDDPLFDGLDGNLDVFHWHEDMSELPSGAKLLSSSAGCPHQAFKVGNNAYGLQFHIEVTRPTVCTWVDKYFSGDPTREKRKNEIINDFQKKKEQFNRIAETINTNFLKIISQ